MIQSWVLKLSLDPSGHLSCFGVSRFLPFDSFAVSRYAASCSSGGVSWDFFVFVRSGLSGRTGGGNT